LSEAVYKHVYANPPYPRTVKPDLSPELEEVILRCLAKRPEDRYGSAAKLAVALRTLSLSTAAPEPVAHSAPSINIDPVVIPKPEVNIDPVVSPDPVVGPEPIASSVPVFNPEPVVSSGPVVNADPVVDDEPAFSITSKFVPQAAVRLSLVDHRVALAPGETQQLRVAVANTGSASNEFLIEIESSPVVQTPVEPQRIRLDVEQQQTVMLSVSLDPESRVVPGEYRIRILARAASNSTVTDTAFAAAVILPTRQSPLTIREIGASSGNQKDYQLELFNEGSATAHFTLKASDPENVLQYRFRTNIITVEPGRSRTIVLTVRDLFGDRTRTSTIQFQVVATPSKGPVVSTSASFTRSATRSSGVSKMVLRIAVAFVLLLVAAAVVLHFFHYGSAHGANAPAGSTTSAQSSAAVAVPTEAPTALPSAQSTAQSTATQPPTTTPAAAVPPASSQAPVVVRRVTTNKPEVALTFSIANDDASAGKVDAILSILQAQGIHASFSFRGDWAEAHPDVIKAIVAGGHQLVNQTYDSQSFTGASTNGQPLSSAQRIDELTHAAQVVKQITGVDMAPYYRPPYGDVDTGGSTSVATDAAQAGYSVAVLWSIDTESWVAGQTVDQMVSTASKAQSGDIVLFNLTLAGGNKDTDSLPQIITELSAKGLSFVTVKELVGR
jgi:peptidoglycan/xylan/chitin deacetylase (PgdA/CDA1 family)